MTSSSKKARGYAALAKDKPLEPFHFDRRAPREDDIVISIKFCGVCHSDIHQARDEWGGSRFPMVPGHEIIGEVIEVGSKVKKFKVGDRAAIGCLVDSCGDCPSCQADLEQYCFNGGSGTYNSLEQDKKTPTQGGYSDIIVARESFCLKVSKDLDMAAAAPLLCAGITTYSPLRHWDVKKGQSVAVVGLGGLGHMGVKLAASFGANVTVITTSENKREDAMRLGAKSVIISKNPNEMKAARGRFDFILNTVSADHDLNALLALLKVDGSMVLVGAPEKPMQVASFSLLGGRKSLAGSAIGGIAETQEMLDYCAKHNITSDIELIPIQKINEAYDRMLKNDVKYRFVIDMNSLPH
ncbi:MAG: NAD(P)-dependent alcohol dehydrogenase [Proteobacteria bacterium]|nr:MAG: NAD(P)-dependent alcohol dehydrogenase [Pseudomonadota bacterium]